MIWYREKTVFKIAVCMTMFVCYKQKSQGMFLIESLCQCFLISTEYLLNLTVARSFCVISLACLPCCMRRLTSNPTWLWCSSSVSRSSLAVFFAAENCLFVEAVTVILSKFYTLRVYCETNFFNKYVNMLYIYRKIKRNFL